MAHLQQLGCAIVCEIDEFRDWYTNMDEIRLCYNLKSYWRVEQTFDEKRPFSKDPYSVVWFGDSYNQPLRSRLGSESKYMVDIKRGKTVTVAGVFEERNGIKDNYWHVFDNQSELRRSTM